MSAASLIRETRKLITPPEKWAQGDYATDRNGFPVCYQDDDAYCFCIMGALLRVSTSGQGTRAAVEALEEQCPGGIVKFNDRHTHEEVLALLDKAAAEVDLEEAR